MQVNVVQKILKVRKKTDQLELFKSAIGFYL